MLRHAYVSGGTELVEMFPLRYEICRLGLCLSGLTSIFQVMHLLKGMLKLRNVHTIWSELGLTTVVISHQGSGIQVRWLNRCISKDGSCRGRLAHTEKHCVAFPRQLQAKECIHALQDNALQVPAPVPRVEELAQCWPWPNSPYCSGQLIHSDRMSHGLDYLLPGHLARLGELSILLHFPGRTNALKMPIGLNLACFSSKSFPDITCLLVEKVF